MAVVARLVAGDPDTDRECAGWKMRTGQARRRRVHGTPKVLSDVFRRGRVVTWQRDDELVPAKPAREARIRKVRGDDGSDGLYRIRAGAMAVRVVHRFEPVHVEHEHRDRLVELTRRPHRGSQPIFE